MINLKYWNISFLSLFLLLFTPSIIFCHKDTKKRSSTKIFSYFFVTLCLCGNDFFYFYENPEYTKANYELQYTYD